MMKTSKGLIEFTLRKYGNMEREARGKAGLADTSRVKERGRKHCL